MTSAELRQKFLNEYAEFLLEQYGDVIKGKGNFVSLLVKPREDMWELLKDIIIKSSDLEAVSVQSTHDIITMLSKGKITIKDAKDLMSLLQTKQDIEELPKLVEALHTIESK